MPSYLDLAFIAVVLVSALLAMLRGVTREIMAIVSWGAAAAAAIAFYPVLLPKLSDPHSPIYISKEILRPYISGAAIFFVVLIVVSLVTVRISNLILDSKIGALDRSLGFVFGAARGLLLCAIAFIFFNWLVPIPTKAEPDSDAGLRKEWLANSKTLPLVKMTADELLSLLPNDPEGLFAKLKKPKAANGETTPQGNSASKTAPATPSPPVRPKNMGGEGAR